MSPNTGMSEEERRELIARQHRALYGETSNLYDGAKGGNGRPGSQDARVLGGGRGGNPRGDDSVGPGPKALWRTIRSARSRVARWTVRCRCRQGVTATTRTVARTTHRRRIKTP